MSEVQDVSGPEPPSVDNDDTAVATRPPAKFRFHMEIPLFSLFFAVSLSGVVINNMLLGRACRFSLGYNETVCSELQKPGAHDEELEGKVQAAVTMVTMVQAVLEGVFPAVLSLFLGAWSNKHGRKPLCTWPLFGLSLSMMLTVAYSLAEVSPWWFALTSLPYSLSGGGCTLFTGAFCHMSDVSTPENRSMRLSILETSIFVGGILGSLASSYAHRYLGTTYLLLVTAGLMVFSYVYAVVFVRESVVGAVPGNIRSIINTDFVKDMFRTCFKRRPHFVRAAIFLLIGASTISIFILYGLFNIDYLYARRKLSWQLEQYNVYSAVATSILVLGMFLGIGVLQKRLGVGDGVMILVSLASSVAESLCKAVATVTASWLMYLGAGISLFRGLSSPLIRSTLSKTVAPVDVAKVFALLSALEAIFPVLSPVVYNVLYKYTLSVLPETVYLMTMGLYGLAFILVGVANYLMKYHNGPINYTQLVED